MLLHKQKQTEKFIDLKELSKLLLFNDTRSAIKWCQNKDIEVQVIGNKQVVYSFLVDMELDKKLINQLQTKYPSKWEELYRCYKKEDRIGYLLLIDDDIPINLKPISQQAIPQSSFSESFSNT